MAFGLTPGWTGRVRDRWSWDQAIKGGIGAGPLGFIAGGMKGDGSTGAGYRAMSGLAGGMGPAAQAGYSDFRDNQQSLVHRLEAMSRGEGPSLAQQQLEAATDRGQKAQQSMAAGARGPNAAMAQFQAANNMSNISAQAGQDAAAARIAEQFNALNQLGLTLHGARGADEGMNRFNVDQLNNRDVQNWNAQMQAQLAMDQMRNRPGLGDQLLAGGMNMLGMAAGGSMGQPQWMQQQGQGQPLQQQTGWSTAARGGLVDPWGTGNEWAQPQPANQPGWVQTPWNQPGMR